MLFAQYAIQKQVIKQEYQERNPCIRRIRSPEDYDTKLNISVAEENSS